LCRTRIEACEQLIVFAQKYIDLYTKRLLHWPFKKGTALFFHPVHDEWISGRAAFKSRTGEEDPQKFQARIDELIPSFEAAYDDRLKQMLAANYQHAAAE
jgi:hypothetical protein